MTGQVGNKWFLQLLSSGDTLYKIKRLQLKTLLAIPSLGPKYAAKIQVWQMDAIFSVEEPYVGEIIIEDAGRLLQLREIEKELKSCCEAQNQRSSIAQHITSIPGFGVICSAILAGKIGSITRFTSEASLAVYIGMANLDRSSGKKQG